MRIRMRGEAIVCACEVDYKAEANVAVLNACAARLEDWQESDAGVTQIWLRRVR
jgi:hypothetical protein